MENNRIRMLISDIEKVLLSVRDEVVAGAGNADVQYKEDGTEQTQMDIHVEQEVFAHVSSKYPEVAFYGEESGYDLPLPSICCLLDPIDGTKSYAEGTESYTAMAVVIVNNEAVGSIIYRYYDGVSFISIKGEGATRNGEVINLSDIPTPKLLYCRERMIPQVSELAEFSEMTVEKGPTGAGHGFSLVAEGRIAARINAPHSIGDGGYIHDYAPGTLLISEAGGSVIPFRSEKYDIADFSFVACHPNLTKHMRKLHSTLAQIELDSLRK